MIAKNSLSSNDRIGSLGGHGNVVFSKIVKKKGNFGIFFKRLLTLTDEPKLAYTNNGDIIFKKFIDLGEQTKVSKINHTTFKMNYLDLAVLTPSVSGSFAA